jgi:rhodanese-related sulfurtransferase
VSSIGSKAWALLREVLIVGVAAAVVALILTKLRPSNKVESGPPDSRPLVAVGAPAPLANSAFQAHETNLVLVTSPTCHFCQASEPFHRRLAELAAKKSAPLYVVVPNVGAARDYLKAAHLTRAAAYRNSEMGVRVLGTPTLILVDATGTARRVWSGKIPAKMEDAVLRTIEERMDGNAKASAERESMEPGAIILDPRERGDYARLHVARAVNIPFAELGLRMRYELSNSTPTLIDCSNISSTMCDQTVALLEDAGFKARAMDQGASFESCRRHRCEGTAAP